MTVGKPRIEPLSRAATAMRFDRPAEPIAKPSCPDHQVPMVYVPQDDKMKCSQAGCTKVGRKQRDFTERLGSDSVRPAVYRGAIDIVLDAEGRPYLYLVDANCMVDVSRIVDSVEDLGDAIRGKVDTTAPRRGVASQ